MPNFLKRPTAPPIVGSGYGPYLRTPGARGFAGGGDSMYSPLDLFGMTNYGEGIGGGTSMPAAEPAPVEDSFDMLRMFMELTPEEKIRVAGPNFNEMSEEEIGMAMYDFISEGRALSGGREVDYMDPEKQEYAAGGIARSPLVRRPLVRPQRPPGVFIGEGDNPRFNIPAPSMSRVPLGRSVRPPRIGTPMPSIPLGPSDKPERGNKGSPPDFSSLYNAVVQGTPEPIREVRPPRIGTPPPPFDPNLGQPPPMRPPVMQPPGRIPGGHPIRIPEPVGPMPEMPPLTPMPQTPMSSPVIPQVAPDTRTPEERQAADREWELRLAKLEAERLANPPVPEAVPLSIEEKRNWGVRQPRTVPEMTPEMLAILKSMPEVEGEGIPPQPDEMPGMPLPRFEGDNPRWNIPAPGDPIPPPEVLYGEDWDMFPTPETLEANPLPLTPDPETPSINDLLSTIPPDVLNPDGTPPWVDPIETAPDGGPPGGPPIEPMPPDVFPGEPEQTAQPTKEEFMERLMQMIQALQERSQPAPQAAPQAAPPQQWAPPPPRPPVAAFNMGNASAPMAAPTMPQMFNSGLGFFTPQQRGPIIDPGAIPQQQIPMSGGSPYKLDFSSFLRNR